MTDAALSRAAVPGDKMPLEAFGQTDVGRRRKLNEDNYLVKPETNLYAVCDGMGGHNAGEVASKMAIETLEAFIRKSAGEEKDITWPYGLEAHLSFEANRGMGTTLVAAIVSGKVVTIGSAGDSRAYLFRRGELKQLTRDDSWVSAAWAEGILTHDEIDRHPLRNVITKAVGAKEEIELETVEHQLEKGDVIMLCSDGLHSMINDEAILKTVTPFPATLPAAAQKLIDAANEAGGKDNVSVVLLRYTE